MYNQNIDRINLQIQELERLKNGFQSMTQQPIQNIINTQPSVANFEARYLNENDKVEEILVRTKTAFICPKKGYLKIKDTDGNIIEYVLTKPKDEKDLRIEELERKLKEYELIKSNTKEYEPTTNDNEPNDTTTKVSSKSVSKK